MFIRQSAAQKDACAPPPPPSSLLLPLRLPLLPTLSLRSTTRRPLPVPWEALGLPLLTPGPRTPHMRRCNMQVTIR
jgi:hypothetical protein